MENIRYRNENFETSINDVNARNPAKIMAYEIFKLGNTDIPQYLLDNYNVAFKPVQKKALSYLINHNVYDEEWEDSNYQLIFCNAIISSLNEYLSKDFKYALWLADLGSVYDTYTDEKEDPFIQGYKVSDHKLTDLGDEGALYLYETDPKPYSIIEE